MNKVNTKMMVTVDIDSTSDFRKKHTLSPNVLLLTLPNDRSTKNKQCHNERHPVELHFHQQEKYQTTPYDNDYNIHDSSLLSYTWQRRSDKVVEQLTSAPDVAYRFAYLEQPKEKNQLQLLVLIH